MKNYFLLLATLVSLAGCNQNLQSAEGSVPPDTAVIAGKEMIARSTLASQSVVLIELLNFRGKFVSLCSGTLIAKNKVLTAAHCFDSHLIVGMVTFNIVFDSNYIFGRPKVALRGVRYVQHPQYNTDRYMNRINYDHDVAVATFRGTIPSGFRVAEIDSDADANYQGENMDIYGYGRTQDYSGKPNEDVFYSIGTLHSGEVTVTDQFSEFPDRYHTTRGTKNQICVGDSGGPQFYQKNEVLKVVGINSSEGGLPLPSGRISCIGPGQATKVAAFYKWIKEQ